MKAKIKHIIKHFQEHIKNYVPVYRKIYFRNLKFVQQLVYILKEGEKTIESVNSQNILVKFISHSDFYPVEELRGKLAIKPVVVDALCEYDLQHAVSGGALRW